MAVVKMHLLSYLYLNQIYNFKFKLKPFLHFTITTLIASLLKDQK
jgi:hypothetical protein